LADNVGGLDHHRKCGSEQAREYPDCFKVTGFVCGPAGGGDHNPANHEFKHRARRRLLCACGEHRSKRRPEPAIVQKRQRAAQRQAQREPEIGCQSRYRDSYDDDGEEVAPDAALDELGPRERQRFFLVKGALSKAVI